ncbi:MAG: glycosyltransferase, partial [Fimbriimonas ginsengisoli]|nr:glycosyltransferase [Fimbriimonas ginsengisoli]
VIGGGFDRLGGQNLIQPLACGKPVLHGPHMNNFADVTASALAAGASSVCSTAQELSASLKQLLDDPEEREKMGAAARELVKQNAGASRRYAEAIAAEATR